MFERMVLGFFKRHKWAKPISKIIITFIILIDMNTKYAETHEADDFELLKELNSVFHLDELGRTPQGYATDASGYTKGRYIEIELKRRYINVNTYSSIIIEPYKMQYAKDRKDTIQLYVNFTNDNHAIVFNLHRMGNATKTEYDIPSKLYERTKTSNRYNLPMSKAWIYKKDGNKYTLIQKGW